MVLWSIAKFELRKGLTRLSTYIYFAIFFAIGLFLFLAAGGAFQSIVASMGTGGKVVINSPFSLFQFIGVISYFGVLIMSGIMGQAVYQDFLNDTYPFFFTAPIRKWQYLGGRFLGSVLLLIFIFSSIGLGLWVGSSFWARCISAWRRWEERCYPST
jgi:ABC-2 type transport system permease protein